MRRSGRLLLALAPGLSWPASAFAQRLGGGGAGTDVSIVRVLAALAVCLAAAFALALVIRGRKQPFAWPAAGWLKQAMARSSRLEVVEARRVSPFADLCLIRCDGTEYLLLCGQSGQQVLRRTMVESPAG